MINKQRKSIQPGYEHIQLLKACILRDAPAVEAWKNWDKVTNIDDIDNASMRLLPSLYITLRDNNIHTEHINKIKGVYRRTVVKNKILINSMIDVQRSLSNSNIDAIILKGGALILNNYYKDPYQRPMSDIDILVKPKDEIRAKEILRKSNWETVHQFNKYTNPLLPSLNYYKKPNMEIDLHWYLFFEGPDINIDQELWLTTKYVKFADITFCVLNPTFQFMHVCIHGVQWSGSFPLRWIMDAMLIINTDEKIDWELIIRHTKIRRLTIPMLTALKIIRNIFPEIVPGYVIRQLSRNKSVLEYCWYYFARRKPIPLFGRFIRNYLKYKLFFRHRFAFPGFFRYLQLIYNSKTIIDLPITIIRKLYYQFYQNTVVHD